MDVISYALSKKYTDEKITEQKLKVAKVEKELNDYKKVMSQVNVNHEAKQSASGYGIVSLPKNAANGQVSSVQILGRTLKNELKYNCDTWEEWTLSDGVVADTTGLEFTSNGSFPNAVFPNIKWKPSTKYALLYFVVNNNLDKTIYMAGISEKNIFMNEGLGNQKRVFTTLSELDRDYMRITMHEKNTIGTKIKFDNIRLFELPADSEIENDFESMTADELAIKYPFVSGTKSTISASRLKSVGKNLFDNKVGQKLSDYTTVLGSGYRLLPIKLAPNTTYTLSRWQNGWVYDSGFQMMLNDKNDNILLLISNPGELEPRTITTDEGGIIYLKIRYGNNTQLKTILETVLVQIEIGNKSTPYEPYTESTQYLSNVGELRSLLNGVRDEIRVSGGKAELIKRVSEYTLQPIAEPEIIPIEVSGNIVSNPNGTIYIEPVVADANVYNDGIIIFEQELNIDYIDKIAKVDYVTGVETPLDISKAVIAEDKKSFTHPDLMNGDMVFFEYFYSNETTEGNATVEFYDSRYTIKDKSTDKYYQWDIEVDNGVPSIKLKEV